MAARMKKQILTGVTKVQMEHAFSDYTMADTQIVKMKADMESEIAGIKEKYANDMLKYSDVKDKSFHVMHAYATENKAKLFGKKKSAKTIYGIFGFRTGTPKLKMMPGFTWTSVTSNLREFLPDYVRIHEEPAKDLLLSDRNKPEIAGLFGKVGVYVDRDESFFVERKEEYVI